MTAITNLAIADGQLQSSRLPIGVARVSSSSCLRMSDERLSWHLENWAAWQRRRFGHFRRLWYPSKAAGNFQCEHSDFDSMVEQADIRCAKAVEAILSGLTVIQECAIHHRLLSAVYNFPRANMLEQYNIACELLRKGLTVRGIF